MTQWKTLVKCLVIKNVVRHLVVNILLHLLLIGGNPSSCLRDTEGMCLDRRPLEDGKTCESYKDDYTQCSLYMRCDFYESKGCGIMTSYNGKNGVFIQ
jgi:hypothetical protein